MSDSGDRNKRKSGRELGNTWEDGPTHSPSRSRVEKKKLVLRPRGREELGVA